MSVASPSVKMALPDQPLSSSTPHLMPFHTHIGTTYGRDERPPPTPLPLSESQESTDSQSTLVDASSSSNPSSSSVATLASTSTLMDVDGDADVGHNNTARLPTADSSHFAASFRGRAMHGVEVDLPEGYAGLVLRSPPGLQEGKSAAFGAKPHKEERNPKSKGRTTRRSKRAPEPEVVEVEGEHEHEGGDGSAPLEEGATRLLQPISTFSSFVLWHPDVAVDEARDEYLRSLTEWTRLAAEIHRAEDC
uniref:Uncharacterized protein n=1 Tax=Ganoderma boninense TaxID=34458 RepID=A0A5K1K7Q6_9APHY|nr:Uncharacterized protein [Ganoderma boninense]